MVARVTLQEDVRNWVAQLLTDALRKVAEQGAAGGAPSDGASDPKVSESRVSTPGAAERAQATGVVLRALRHAVAAALRVPIKIASPTRVPMTQVTTVLKARPVHNSFPGTRGAGVTLRDGYAGHHDALEMRSMSVCSREVIACSAGEGIVHLRSCLPVRSCHIPEASCYWYVGAE